MCEEEMSVVVCAGMGCPVTQVISPCLQASIATTLVPHPTAFNQQPAPQATPYPVPCHYLIRMSLSCTTNQVTKSTPDTASSLCSAASSGTSWEDTCCVQNMCHDEKVYGEQGVQKRAAATTKASRAQAKATAGEQLVGKTTRQVRNTNTLASNAKSPAFQTK